MTERLDPIRPYGDRRQFRRRGEDQAQAHAEAAPEQARGGANLPVPAGPQARERPSSSPLDGPLDGQAAFSAQLLGQPGVRRGLRGGPGVVEAARSAYLETEYSGPADRRPSKGLLKKTDI